MTEIQIALRLAIALGLCAAIFLGTILSVVYLWEMSPLIVLSLAGIYGIVRAVRKYDS